MNADSTRQLGNATDGELYLFTCSHDKVTKLIDYHNDVRHIFMPVLWVQLTVLELFVVLLDVAHMGTLEKVITSIHKLAKRVERLYHFLHICNDTVFFFLKTSQEVVLYRAIDTEFNLLRVNHHNLQLRWMLLVKQRSHNSIQADRLTLTGCASHQEVRRFGQVKHEHLVANGLAHSAWKFHLALLIHTAIDDTFHRHDALLLVWHFNADGTLARNRSDDSDTFCCQRQSDIIFKVTNLADANNFIKRDGWANGCLDAGNLDTKIFQDVNDAVLIRILLNHVYLRTLVICLLQQIKRWVLIELQIQFGVIRSIDVATQNVAITFIRLIHFHNQSAFITSNQLVLLRMRHYICSRKVFWQHAYNTISCLSNILTKISIVFH